MRKSKVISILIAVIFVFTTMLGAVPSQVIAASNLSDINGHWAQSQIQSLITKGIINGYPDNTFKPNNTISRAEFITMINKAFSFTNTTQTSYTDVPANEWYASEIAKAKAAGYIAGYEDGTMRPGAQISRQEVAKILAVILKLDSSSDSAVSGFNDAVSIPAWSRGYVAAMVTAGYIDGYPDGTFKANNAINRAEASVILCRALQTEVQTVFDKAGTYGPASGTQTINSDVIVNADGVTLQNMIIKGNLLVADSVGEGNVNFKNVTVTSTTTIKGGGIHSITFDNCIVNIVIVNKPASPVRVKFLNNCQVSKLQLDSASTIEGGGIAQAIINVNGVVIETAPGSYVVATGITATIGGKTVTGTPVSGGGGGGGGGPTTVPVTGITLNYTTRDLALGDSFTLTATVAPANATNKEVVWTSDRPTIAAVDESTGRVTAVNADPDPVTITATTADGNFTATCRVTVRSIVTGVSLNKANMSMLAGATAQLVPIVAPENATEKDVSWESDDDTVATVDANGVVTAAALGTAAITVTTDQGGYQATCLVTVAAATIAVDSVTLNQNSLTLKKGADFNLVGIISPADATNTNITWTSSASGIADVDSATGKVTAVGKGTATITATTADGSMTDTCTVSVTEPVTSISITPPTLANGFAVGDADVYATATVLPANADNKNVIWSTGDSKVALVDNTGKVTPMGPGTTAITVTTVDGGYAASWVVTVGIRATGAVMSQSVISLKVGGTYTLSATVQPGTCTNKALTWTSASNGIATVSNGLVTGIAAGSTTITATPQLKTATATSATSTVKVYNVTGPVLAKNASALMSGLNLATVQFTVAAPAADIYNLTVSLNDGTAMQFQSQAGSTYTFAGATTTSLTGINTATVTINGTLAFTFSF